MVFSGSGGQGVITAAILLAEAAVIHEGLIAVQSQTYGPEARGGATRSDVIISDTDILFPKVTQPNVLVCLTQEAYNKFHPIVRPGGLLISDPHFVKTHIVDAVSREVAMYQSVLDRIVNPQVFNICMLGVVIGLTAVIKSESLVKTLEQRLPAALIDANRRALDLGIELARAA